MRMRVAITIARREANRQCKLSPHYGESQRRDRGLRLTACTAEEADQIGPRIANAVSGTYRSAAGFACVWI
jgi:hypothetical protein